MPERIKRYTISATGEMDGDYFRASDVIELVEGIKAGLVIGPPSEEAEGGITTLEAVLAFLSKKTPEEGRSVVAPRCPWCNLDIDPEVCFCGSPKDDHAKRHRFRPKGCVCSLLPKSPRFTEKDCGDVPRAKVDLRASIDAVLNYRFEDETSEIKQRLESRQFVYHIFELPYARRFRLFTDFLLIGPDENGMTDAEMIPVALKRLRGKMVVEQRDFLQRFDLLRGRMKGEG